MERTSRAVDEFIAELSDDVRPDIEILDRGLSSALSGQERVLFEGKLWGGTDQEIIGYGTYEYGKDSVEWLGVGLAGQKKYLSI